MVDVGTTALITANRAKSRVKLSTANESVTVYWTSHSTFSGVFIPHAAVQSDEQTLKSLAVHRPFAVEFSKSS